MVGGMVRLDRHGVLLSPVAVLVRSNIDARNLCDGDAWFNRSYNSLTCPTHECSSMRVGGGLWSLPSTGAPRELWSTARRMVFKLFGVWRLLFTIVFAVISVRVLVPGTHIICFILAVSWKTTVVPFFKVKQQCIDPTR